MQVYINEQLSDLFYAPSPIKHEGRVYALPEHLDNIIGFSACKWFDETKMFWVRRAEKQFTVSPLQFVANDQDVLPVSYAITNARCYWPMKLVVEALGGTYTEQEQSINIEISPIE